MESIDVKYSYVNANREQETRVWTVEYQTIGSLPNGTNNRVVFERAIRQAASPEISAVLNDVFRYFTFGHFSHEKADINVAFPYKGAIPEGDSSNARDNRSTQTNATGAVLYLYINTKASLPNKRILGGLVYSMLRHRKYGGSLESLATPVIDVK